MKITTANIKNVLYNENHEIFVGTHTGTFKKISVADENPHKQTNLQNISALKVFSKITSLNWGDENEILIGRANKFVKIYDTSTDNFTSNIEMMDGPIVGLARYDGKLIAGISNGKIQILADSPTILEAGDNLSNMRQCQEEKKLIATGGKDRQNNLKLWNLETLQKVFSSKNVPNDSLQLEVPVWDNDFSFIDPNCLVTCSRYGYVRTYDIRNQRRPVLQYVNSKEDVTYTCLATHENMVYVGAATGILRAYDVRKLKTIMHTYKGFTGSISDVGVDETGKYVYTACLDRYVRVHCSQSTALQYQCYVKSKVTKILLRKTPISIYDSSSECVFLGNEELSDNEKDVEKVKSPPNDDPEFEALFQNMPTVQDGDNDNKSRKRKKSNSNKIMKKIK